MFLMVPFQHDHRKSPCAQCVFSYIRCRDSRWGFGICREPHLHHHQQAKRRSGSRLSDHLERLRDCGRELVMPRPRIQGSGELSQARRRRDHRRSADERLDNWKRAFFNRVHALKSATLLSRIVAMAKNPRSSYACTCRKCAHEIPLATVEALAEEFSVSCPDCGRRDIYSKKKIHALNAQAESESRPSLLDTLMLPGRPRHQKF
jgi:hypothetical protein